jgi:hypothetical protein
MFLCAFALSGAAAFYSVVGLMAIFAASPIPIAIMGSILEVSKLVVASWLYRNWNPAPLFMKSYLTVALVILMGLTSMGIFGYLSKAHLDQGVPTSDIAAKLALIEEKINTQRENANAARKTLNQLDEQVNQTLARTSTATDDNAVGRSVAIRRGQAKERAILSKEIERATAEIAKLNEEKAPIASELRKVEAEVGPIKYIAAIIYGDEVASETTFLEKAVRWVTILIVSVFDPLAVMMLIAANWSLTRTSSTPPEEEPKPKLPKVDPPSEPVTKVAKKNYSVVISSETDNPVPTEQPVDLPPKVQDVADSIKIEEHPAFDITKETFWRSRPPKKDS